MPVVLHSEHAPTWTEVVAEDDGGGAILVVTFDVQVKLTNQACRPAAGPTDCSGDDPDAYCFLAIAFQRRFLL